MSNSYNVINASAGSGKTYSLVKNLLKICLRYDNQADKIRNILALTFTNKAANEMKERILDWLYAFTKEDYEQNNELINIQREFETENIHSTLKNLHLRSKKVLDYLLHNYSTLNISTIDKFNSRLVRSFTYELGLAQNFNLEINAEPYLIEAVDLLLNEIGEDAKVSESFMDFITYNLENDTKVSVDRDLYKAAKEFIKDTHYEALLKNEHFDWKAYELKKNTLRERIKQNRTKSLDIAKQQIDYINSQDLNISDFAGGTKNSIALFFDKIVKFYNKESSSFPIPGDENSAINIFNQLNSTKSKGKEAAIASILPQLLSARLELINLYSDTHRSKVILDSLLPLKFNTEIQNKLKSIEQENDLVLLSKFNIIINENLRTEPSSFIYEKIGAKFQHFFFDEFQDTSKMQWENFLPLRDNSISSEGNTFTIVGDPKQSIYRFRGGDSQLMLDIINQKEQTLTPPQVINLEHNWRSAKNIVDFNNNLYKNLSQYLKEDHQLIFNEAAQQQAKYNINGRVRVNLIDNLKKEEFYKEVITKMHQDIQGCLDNGFELTDICILCRNNNDIFEYASLLAQMQVNYKGNIDYIKTISESGLTIDLSYTVKALIEYLKWINNPHNFQFLIKMLYYLNHTGRIKIKDFTDEIENLIESKNFEDINTKLISDYDLDLKSQNILNLNLYNYIEHYLQLFSVKNKEVDFTLNFLEMLNNYTQNSAATIKDFLKYWDEEGYNTAIKASENIDAIKMMTIHKSKGLEFPVVMIPYRNENNDTRFKAWFNINEDESLKNVNISKFDEKILAYDPELKIFNQENTYKNLLDRFCVQYVATTRAIEQLYLFLEKPGKTDKLEMLQYIDLQNKLIDNQDHPESFDLYEVSANDIKKQKNKQKSTTNKIGITDINTGQLQKDSIKIATPSKTYQRKKERVKLGIFVHEVLEKIKTKEDVANVLAKYELQGLITCDERIEIESRINHVVLSDKYQKYFDIKNKVINERDMMIMINGKSEKMRIDRLIETKEGFVIIDFKTGEILEKHQQQIEKYKNALESFGKKVCETLIISI